jgi:hypothetical protein
VNPRLICKYYIVIPCLPAEDNEAIENATALVEDFEEHTLFDQAFICVNKPAEELSVVFGINDFESNDAEYLLPLEELAKEKDIPVVLYATANKSHRKGFWPDEDDTWIEQEGDCYNWKVILDELFSLTVITLRDA